MIRIAPAIKSCARNNSPKPLGYKLEFDIEDCHDRLSIDRFHVWRKPLRLTNMQNIVHSIYATVAVCCFLVSQSAQAQVTLVEEGRAAATIVVPDGNLEAPDGRELPAGSALTAAKELQKFIARASGAELPIVGASQAPRDGTLLLVGRSALSEQFGIPVPNKSEGVRIQTFRRGLAILGEIATEGTNNRPFPHDRGTLNATYLFLEKYVGYRFYFQRGPDADLGMVVPRQHTITVGPIDFTSAPAFPYRAIVPYSGSGEWKAATRPGQSTGFSCNHTHLGWDGRYKETHPEYFSLGANGKRNFRFLCYGNPDVLRRELEHTKTYYETGQRIGGSPGEKYIPVEPGDNWMECRCELCQALIEPTRGRFGRHSRLWWDQYIRNLGLAVQQRWPAKRVAALAYQGRILPGDGDLPDNVDVQVCIHNAPLNFYKEPAARDEIRTLLSAWSTKLGGDRSRLYVWDYTCYPQYWTCAPTLYPHTLQQFLRENRHLISGVFINGGDEIIQADHYMVAVTFSLLWDANLDVDAHLRDYCKKFFGPAADPMERLYHLLIKRYEQTNWPNYSPSRYTSYASPTMFYGQTYTAPVVEQIEQLLCEAEEAAGRLPDGRPAEFVGEGWFIRRNTSEAARPFEIVMQATDQAVRWPTVKWAGGQVLYQDTLVRGQKLVVRPGPTAVLLPAEALPPQELIPPDRRLADGLQPFSRGYVVHTARNLRIPAFPGAQFRITVTGKATDGANSIVAVQWSTGQWSYHIQNHFDAEPRTVSEVITAPANARSLNHVYVYRSNKKGTVWYGDLSVRREFPRMQDTLPADGKDVTAYIAGNAPVLPARTSRVFHVFTDNVEAGAGEEAATEDETVSAVGVGTLRVTVRPMVTSPVASQMNEPTIYQRRVAWMSDGWENFHPRQSMYRSHDGFLVAAWTAHKWIGRTPTYKVRWVDAPPPQDLSTAVWKDCPMTTLIRGRSRASVPVDNLGFDPGNGVTQVRIVQDDKSIYAAFHCIQLEKPNEHDSVTLTLYRKDEQLISVTCRPNGLTLPDTEGPTSATFSGRGWWTAFLTIPKSTVSGVSTTECRADLVRTRRDRSYVWSPPLNAPWTDMPMARRGRIVFDTK